MTIAQLPDGREFQFPDDMPEGQVETFVQALIDAEEAASEAKAETAKLREELKALQNKPAPKAVVAKDDGVAALAQEVKQGMAKLATLVSADRTIIYDELGNPRSRIVR